MSEKKTSLQVLAETLAHESWVLQSRQDPTIYDVIRVLDIAIDGIRSLCAEADKTTATIRSMVTDANGGP